MGTARGRRAMHGRLRTFHSSPSACATWVLCFFTFLCLCFLANQPVSVGCCSFLTCYLLHRTAPSHISQPPTLSAMYRNLLHPTTHSHCSLATIPIQWPIPIVSQSHTSRSHTLRKQKARWPCTHPSPHSPYNLLAGGLSLVNQNHPLGVVLVLSTPPSPSHPLVRT